MHPEISASNVAGFIGLHKYKPQDEIFYSILCRDKEARKKVEQIEEEHRRTAYQTVVKNVMSDSAIQDCISVGLNACRKTPDVASALENVEDAARIVLSLRHDYPEELAEQLAAEVRGKVTKQRGIQNENSILNTYETDNNVKVTERNTKNMKKNCGTFTLTGRIDGYVESENRIVDSKDRTRKWDSVPIYDEIQLRTYMFMTGAREAELVERFPDGTKRVTKYENDPVGWAKIQAVIEKNVAKLVDWKNNEEEVKRIVFANTVQLA